jgi:hypothetical protein
MSILLNVEDSFAAIDLLVFGQRVMLEKTQDLTELQATHWHDPYSSMGWAVARLNWMLQWLPEQLTATGSTSVADPTKAAKRKAPATSLVKQSEMSSTVASKLKPPSHICLQGRTQHVYVIYIYNIYII